MRRILELPEYASLSESEENWSLTPAREDTYALLDDLFNDHLACFSSRYVNVCADEVYDLGKGQSKELAERLGLGRLFLQHIVRLHQLAQKYGRTLMVWDDVLLHYPEVIGEAPHDAIIMHWKYDAADDYYPQVEGVHAAGLRQMICPGTSTWNTLFPRLANSRTNIRNFVAAGLRVGALGVLNTDWGDHGHPNMLGSSWYGYAYGASEGWAPGVLADDEFGRRLSVLLFGEHDASAVLGAMQALTEACLQPCIARENGSHSIPLFFGDPLTSEECRAIPDASLASMEDLGRRAQVLLADVAGTGDDEAARTLAEFRLIADMVVFAAARARAARLLASATEPEAKRALDRELEGLKHELHDLRWRYEAIWLARNKPDGVWLTLDKIDDSAQAMNEWRRSLQPAYHWYM
jgi:hypothetical protein